MRAQQLSSPAAERNKAPILEVLERVLPRSGVVLEIASGTGQHVVHFAKALQELAWQPSDASAEARESIAAWVASEKLDNVCNPLNLDVRVTPWPIAACDAILCINMIHISPWAATEALFAGAARVLPRGSLLYLYGPFRIAGEHTAPSNEAFDASLRSQDAAWGVRDLHDVVKAANRNGFVLSETVPMPSNNLSVIFHKRGAKP